MLFEIDEAEAKRAAHEAAGLPPYVMVDCSHGNSDKKADRQEEVLRSLLESRGSGCRDVIGFMMESNLYGGKQEIPRDPSRLKFGVSITDPCLSWEKTEQLLLYACQQHAVGLEHRSAQ